MNYEFQARITEKGITSASINGITEAIVNHDHAPKKCFDKNDVEVFNGIRSTRKDALHAQCLELASATSRKKPISAFVHADQVELVDYLRKTNIEVKVEDGDTLRSLALKYNCAVSEIKSVNRIYADQEFHALSTILIPVLPFSQLNPAVAISDSRASSKPTLPIEEMSRHIAERLPAHERYRPERLHEMREGFSSLSDEDSESGAFDHDEPLFMESDSLLTRSSPDRDIFARPVDASGKCAEQLLNEIQKRVDDVENLSRSRDLPEAGNSQTRVDIIYPAMADDKKGEALGVLCGCSWRLWIACGFISVVGIPVLLYLAFKNFRSSFPKFN